MEQKPPIRLTPDQAQFGAKPHIHGLPVAYDVLYAVPSIVTDVNEGDEIAFAGTIYRVIYRDRPETETQVVTLHIMAMHSDEKALPKTPEKEDPEWPSEISG
jgi:hypothetical protein